MMVTEDLYLVATTPQEAADMPMPICSICGCAVSLHFRKVHNEKCANE